MNKINNENKRIELMVLGLLIGVGAAIAFTILNSAASVFGAAALAAMGIVNKIYTIVTQMVGGFNNTYLLHHLMLVLTDM